MNTTTGTVTTNTTCLSTNINGTACLNSTGLIVQSEPLNDVLRALDYVNYVFLPTFFVLGLTGNMFTILVMCTKKYSKLTIRYFSIKCWFIVDSTQYSTGDSSTCQVK